MSALLKIVQGPNTGAEIALVDDLETTLGKTDTCDIVLADPTLPDEPLRVTARADGSVSVAAPGADPAPLATAHVVFYGSSAIAVGPADSPWPPLVFPAPPKAESPSPEAGAAAVSSATAGTAGGSPAKAGSVGGPPAKPAESAPSTPRKSKKSRIARFLLWLLALLLLLLLLLGLLFTCSRTRVPADPALLETDSPKTLADYADCYHLDLDESGTRPALSGNFATRAERLAATAELYSAFPGVSLDLTDDESLRTAVSDALFTLGETGLAVADVSNRVATLSGTANSAATLSAALDALHADVPKLDSVDASAVSFRPSSPVAAPAPSRRASRSQRSSTPSLPVCGILTTPYPCLVLQNGTRVFPGANLGGYIVSSISADSVVLTNSTASLIWKP